jgi:hypothetical protein
MAEAEPHICILDAANDSRDSQNPHPPAQNAGRVGHPPGSFFVFTFLGKTPGQNQLRRRSNRRAFTSGHSLSRMLKYTVSLTRPVCVIR